MSSRMRVTRGHTGRRRAHHHIKEPRLSECSNCGALHIRHRACRDCGFYRGKMVVDIIGKKQAKLQKKAKSQAVDKEEQKDNKEVKDTQTKKTPSKKAGAKKVAKKKTTSKKTEESKDS